MWKLIPASEASPLVTFGMVGIALVMAALLVIAIVVAARRQAPLAAFIIAWTAIASYRVDETVISTFRSHRPSDADLIATTAWASLKATQRISTWIAPPFQQRLTSTQAA